jgi:hypothetical protein
MFKKWENRELEKLLVVKGNQPNKGKKKGKKLNNKKT